MELRCRATYDRNSQCNKTAQYLIITGCVNEHLEETPVCAQHKLQWEHYIHGEESNLVMLLCKQCKALVIAGQTTLISRVTAKWMRGYLTKMTTEHVLREIQMGIQ